MIFEGQQPVQAAVDLGLFTHVPEGLKGTPRVYLYGRHQGRCYAVPNPVESNKPKGQEVIFRAALSIPPPDHGTTTAFVRACCS